MEFSLVEMIVIAFVALLLYGGRLPKVAMAVGRALGEFRRGLRETSDMVRFEVQEAERRSEVPSIRPPEPPAERYGAAAEDAVPEPSAEDLATEDISVPEPAAESPPGAGPEDEETEREGKRPATGP